MTGCEQRRITGQKLHRMKSSATLQLRRAKPIMSIAGALHMEVAERPLFDALCKPKVNETRFCNVNIATLNLATTPCHVTANRVHFVVMRNGDTFTVAHAHKESVAFP